MADTPSFPFAWKPLAGHLLEQALNRAIALDPDTRDALRALDGRHVVLEVESPALALRIDVEGGRLRVGPAGGPEPDLAVRGTLGALIGQLPFLQRRGATATGRVRIAGDAELARRLQGLARGFDPDWQRPFANVFGDVLGVQVAEALAGALRRARVAGRNLAESGAEFLTEESRDLVARAELEAFLDDVDALREGVDRLDARVRRLRASAAARGGTAQGPAP
ncbi:ubiquinone biosynthesis accessory factor UbiJ [Luteimonas huabeiensis]|uniref:ubiquinone biosynthesis accessory factor UbiJ n=1 Tax=Luteimonas huabeiensis TaxID=1244513 RepID=UPI0004643CD2|nr:SCP2 sterol-binding domain-containing protein [Luteimonas huabeiensis]